MMKTIILMLVMIIGVSFSQTTIEERLKQIDELIKLAEEAYDAGEYNKSRAYSEEAKRLAEELKREQEINEKIELLKKEAESKIGEAEGLIKTCEEKGKEQLHREEYIAAKTALADAKTAYEKREYEDSIKLANESIAKAKEFLEKISVKVTMTRDDVVIKTNYKVRLIPERRDCLWRIAEYDFIYGNPTKWPIIYEWNKHQIKDPDLIYPGQILKIPDLKSLEKSREEK